MIPYLRFQILSDTYLPIAHTCIRDYPPPPPPRRLHVSRGKQTWIGTTNASLLMIFLMLDVAFVISFFFFGDMSQEVSCLS